MSLDNATTIARLTRPSIVKTSYQGSVEATAENEFKRETSPQGEEILELTVQVGNVWHVFIRVDIVENDA